MTHRYQGSNSAATIPCQCTSWVDFLTSLKPTFLFCVSLQMFRVSKCCIFMPIKSLSVDSQIRSQCFLVSLVLACGFLINFQRCHVFCFKFKDLFPVDIPFQDKNQQQHPTTLNILLKHHPETKLPPTPGVAAAFILFDFYQPVPPSGWFSHLSLFFWWSIFLWQNSNPFWDWKVAWLRKVGRRVVKRLEQVPSRSM